MYIQFKQGFIEADRWDGNRQLPPHHLRAIDAAGTDAIVARSRERATVEWVVGVAVQRRVDILHTPDWDYEFRCYLSVAEWATTLGRIAQDLDYRNFKAWSHEHSTAQRTELAHGIWHEALVTGSTGPSSSRRRSSSK